MPDQPQQTTTPSIFGGSDSEVQDIFSEGESAPVSPRATSTPTPRPAPTPVTGSVPQPMTPQGMPTPSFTQSSGMPTKRVILMVLIGLVALAVVAAIVYAGMSFFGKKSTEQVPVVPKAQETTNPAPEVKTPETTTPTTEQKPQETTTTPVTTTPAAPSVDTDGDGLTDAEEETLHTDKNIVDSDNDGLTDREEVQAYKTNPISADTDGDGYLDGEEVRNGYNPNGPGKLFVIPSETVPQ